MTTKQEFNFDEFLNGVKKLSKHKTRTNEEVVVEIRKHLANLVKKGDEAIWVILIFAGLDGLIRSGANVRQIKESLSKLLALAQEAAAEQRKAEKQAAKKEAAGAPKGK